MKRSDLLARIRLDNVDRIAASREAIRHLSDPNISMTRRDDDGLPIDLKDLLLSDHQSIISNAEATINMIDDAPAPV